MYPLLDNELNKTSDGSFIICNNDENCIIRFFVECSPSSGVYYDDSVGKGFIFVTRGIYGTNNICLVDIVPGEEGFNDYRCEISKEDISVEMYNNIKTFETRKSLLQCKIIEE